MRKYTINYYGCGQDLFYTPDARAPFSQYEQDKRAVYDTRDEAEAERTRIIERYAHRYPNHFCKAYLRVVPINV